MIMWEEKLEVNPPYNFSESLSRLSLDPIHFVNIEKKEVRLPIYATQKKGTIVYISELNKEEVLQFKVSSQNKEEKETILQEVKRIFQLDRTLTDINEHFKSTNLKSLFEDHSGTPLICDFSLYSCLMKSLIHQQLNLKFAHTLTEKFVHKFGSHVDGVWFYPSPEIIASLNYEDLRNMQFSQRKAEYVIDTSRLIVSGKLHLDEMHHESDEEVMDKLIKVRGIGPWTVQMILMFGLGRSNVLPSADIGIQNALKKYFDLDTKPRKEEIEQLSKDWAPYKSYATLYLWRSIEPKLEVGE